MALGCIVVALFIGCERPSMISPPLSGHWRRRKRRRRCRDANDDCKESYLLRLRRFYYSPIRGMSKKSKEPDLENLVESEKPYKKVMALKDILLREPENVIGLSELGRSVRARVGLTGKSRFATLMSKYPSIFDLHKDEDNHLWCGFTPQAQILVEKEMALIKCYEENVGVHNLRKLLIMSVEHRIHVPKLAQLRRDLGLPTDFHDRLIYAYPHYFKVVQERFRNEHVPVLELIPCHN